MTHEAIQMYVWNLQLELYDKEHALSPREKAGIEAEIATWKNVLHYSKYLTK